MAWCFLVSVAGFTALALVTELQQGAAWPLFARPHHAHIARIWHVFFAAGLNGGRWAVGMDFRSVAYSGHTSAAAAAVHLALIARARTVAKRA